MSTATNTCDAEVAATHWFANRRVFLVLGAMKGGTCALRAHLLQFAREDNLSLPARETHFFDEDDEFARGPAYYKSWFDWGDKWPPPDIIGDVTPSYMYMPAAIPRIHRLLPHARLIVMLRNPIDRALSHQNHDLAKGRPVDPLPERWQRELAEVQRGGRPKSRADVLERGFYATQLERILQYYPRERLLVVVSERYRGDTCRTFQQVREFLGLQGRDVDAGTLMRREVHVRGVYAERLPPHERVRLCDVYADDVSRLRSLLGEALPEWASDFPLPTAAVPGNLAVGQAMGPAAEPCEDQEA